MYLHLQYASLINAFFTPHCDEADEYANRLEHMKYALTNTELVGLGVSNCCALEIVDDEYRLICCDASNYGIDAFAVKVYYKNEKYFLEYMDNTNEFKPLTELLNK